MGNPFKHSIRPVTLVDHRFYEVDATNPDVISFHLVRESLVIKEWSAQEFKSFLVFLDELFQRKIIDSYGWPKASPLLYTHFPLSSIEQSIAIVQFWQATYSIFHPEGNSK